MLKPKPTQPPPSILTPAAQNLGTETAFAVLARVGELAVAGRQVINLGIGQPDFPTPPHIVEAAAKALRDGHHGYTPSLGILPLREAVAASIHHNYKTEVAPSRIQILPGGKPVIFLATQLLGEKGVDMLYPDPGFPIYRSAIAFSGAKPIPYPLTDDGGIAPKATDILQRITPATRLIIVNTPANPSGGVMAASEVKQLAESLASDHPHIALLADEIYDRLVFDDASMASFLCYPALSDQLILLNGWSKAYAMTGWRIGYGVWPQALIEAADRLAINIYSCVNAITQHAACAALTSDQACVATMLEAFQRRGRFLADGLNGLPGVTCAVPKGAFYTLPDVSGVPLPFQELQQRLLEEAGVATIPGTSFGDNGAGHLRISSACKEATIGEALKRVREFLAGL